MLAQTETKLHNQWNVNIVGDQDGYLNPSSVRRCLNAFMPAVRKSSLLRWDRQSRRSSCDCHSGASGCAMDVGGTYDVFTGRKRAPKISETLGLEWLYRLLSRAALSVSFVCCVIYAGTTPATSDFPLFCKRADWSLRHICFCAQTFKFLMLYLPFLLNCNIRNRSIMPITT